jgi:hypothetical protein
VSGGGAASKPFVSFRKVAKPGEQRLPFIFYNGQYINKVFDAAKGALVSTTDAFRLHGRHYAPKLTPPFVNCAAGFKEVVDSNGERGLVVGDEPCVACLNVYRTPRGKDPGAEERQEIDSATINRMYAIVVAAFFHKIDTGRKRQGKYPIYEYKACAGKTCQLCKTGVPRFWGKQEYLDLNRYQIVALEALEEQVYRHCSCGGFISTTGFVCPECKTQFDVDWDLLHADDKEHLLYETDSCEACGKEVQYHEVLTCSKCNEATPLTLYDAVVSFEELGSKDTLTFNLLSCTSLEQFVNEHPEVAAPLQELLADVPTLDYQCATPRPEVQAHVLGVPNPFETTVEAVARTNVTAPASSDEDIPF